MTQPPSSVHPHAGRRRFLAGVASASLAAALPTSRAVAQSPVLSKPIPSSGETIPAVGLGTWRSFDVGSDPQGRQACVDVVRAFFDAGGKVIDSSPMYGSSQAVLGYALQQVPHEGRLFSADKVWVSGREQGLAQIRESAADWGVQRFDLLQVHNLLDWQTQLESLQEMKAQGRVRYVGITTYGGLRHDAFERIMRDHPLDFIQITYNIVDRAAEQRLLPLAREKGIAVLANRPFGQGGLLGRLAGHPLPDWAGDIQAGSWAQLVLKYIVSHPDITCAIPATSKARHARENVESARGPMPDAAFRDRMAGYVAAL